MKNKKYFFVLGLLLIPFISIILIVEFRHVVNPTNEEIIKSITNAKAYKTSVQYTIKNDKGDYSENAKIYYKKNAGYRIEFQENRVKIYKDGYISMKENDYEYNLDEEIDVLYPLGFVNNLIDTKLINVSESTEEWGDEKYIELTIQLTSDNNHLVKAKIYIDKEDKSPVLTRIYDSKGKETVDIVYEKFEYLKTLDNKLF